MSETTDDGRTARTHPVAHRRGGRRLRIASVVAGAVLALAGGGTIGLASAQEVEGGYFSSPEQRFSTATAVVKSDEIAVDAESARAGNPSPDLGELATVRVAVQPVDPNVTVFVGIGPKADVERYLRDVPYEEFVSATFDPFRATFRQVPGSATIADPADQPFWVATSAGTGAQTVEWDKGGGAWSIVVVRLDGASGVDVTASIGLRFGFLLPTGIGLLVAGSGFLLFALASGRRRPTRTEPR
jgi:hypothetical protein